MEKSLKDLIQEDFARLICPDFNLEEDAFISKVDEYLLVWRTAYDCFMQVLYRQDSNFCEEFNYGNLSACQFANGHLAVYRSTNSIFEPVN